MDSDESERSKFIKSLRPYLESIQNSLGNIIDACEQVGMYSKSAKKYVDEEYKVALSVLTSSESTESERAYAWKQAGIFQKARSAGNGDPFTNLLCESEKALNKIMKDFYSEENEKEDE